ncbi:MULTISPECIES: hypothetical protein [Brucella/Ochrobactrum group]|uniref:Uncharacterized protein n=1 Tax=Brucella pseudintermedia TaxID=370111 RepID=A0ABY5UD09_9HYPH|nr:MULTISPECIES: hypothetical protein [Brucella/Ochrobactrum group]KAB2685408.1 hypothetical protein F9K78_01460 [Brucella pseudintermedia]MCO7729067.1 hypothetical protein [Brucella intermedia]NKE76725.1 hypothetical protein [Ochrobactrum sp. MC-1LL]UWL61218.1 hypothetical protein NIK97_05540 [Brucella pseudintermedia]WPM79415.1 hypothetical protein R5W60_09415 [Brucella pseudintermedia]
MAHDAADAIDRARVNDWIGLRGTSDTQLKSVNRLPLFSGFPALSALLLVFGSMRYREGR